MSLKQILYSDTPNVVQYKKNKFLSINHLKLWNFKMINAILEWWVQTHSYLKFRHEWNSIFPSHKIILIISLHRFAVGATHRVQSNSAQQRLVHLRSRGARRHPALQLSLQVRPVLLRQRLWSEMRAPQWNPWTLRLFTDWRPRLSSGLVGFLLHCW